MTTPARRPRPRPWIWSLIMTLIGVVTGGMAVAVVPDAEGMPTWAGEPTNHHCEMLENTGDPCPLCGMTRSWMWTVRGHLWRAVRYNPSGASLLLWAMWGGVVGTARLVSRRHDLLRAPWQLLCGWALLWMVSYVALWVARTFGFNPLPGT